MPPALVTRTSTARGLRATGRRGAGARLDGRDVELAEPRAQLVAIDLHADDELAAGVVGVVARHRELHDPQPRVPDDLAIEVGVARGTNIGRDDIRERRRDRVRERIVERGDARVGAGCRCVALGFVGDDVVGERGRRTRSERGEHHGDKDTAPHAR